MPSPENRSDSVPLRPTPGWDQGLELLAGLRPYVRSCGDERRPAWQLAPRRLLDYLLVAIVDGHGSVTIDGCEQAAEPGDLFWIPPDTDHAMRGEAPGMTCPYVHFDLVYRPQISHWSFHIPGGMTELAELAPLLHPPLTLPLVAGLRGRIRAWNNLRIADLVRELCREAARAQPFAALRLSGLMLEIIAEVLRGRCGPPVERARHIPDLEAAADWLQRAACDQATVGDAAAIAGLSPSRFRELFAAHFGCSPRDWLTRARLRRAKELMIGSQLALGTIAQRCGFATVHNLSRAFRRLEGISPSQYRRYGPAQHLVEGRRASYPH